MMVGNGFHEVRDQTNEKMAAVFKAYRDAGIILIFTEETGLTDEQIREAAYNTYHAGFRWVHRTSGQGLRPSFAPDGDIRSWFESATSGDYDVLMDYTRGTRSIYPYAAPKEDNPSISVTYFCVPKGLFG